MLIEIDQILIKEDLYKRIRSDDNYAKDQLRHELNKMHLYFHNIHQEDDEILITVKELQALRIIKSIEVHTYESGM